MSSDGMGNRTMGSSLSCCHFFLPISSLLLFKPQYPSLSFLLLLVRRHLSRLKHLFPQQTIRRLTTVMLSMVGCCHKHPQAVREEQTRALELGFSSIQAMATTQHKAGTPCPACASPMPACAPICLTASSSPPDRTMLQTPQQVLLLSHATVRATHQLVWYKDGMQRGGGRQGGLQVQS